MLNVPECGWRRETDKADIYYCRHSKMHTQNHLVTPSLCRICVCRTEPCENPRPETYDPTINTGPSLSQMLWNLGESLAAFAADGLTTVSRADYEKRLEICDACNERVGSSCRLCGCFLKVKAQGRAFECPAGKWPQSLSDKESQIPSVQ